MRKQIVSALALAASILISDPVFGCEVTAAEARLMVAQDAGIILGVGFHNDAPSLTVDVATWREMDVDTRLAMIETLECVVVGPGNILAKVQVIAPEGSVLAVFDGIKRKIDIKS